MSNLPFGLSGPGDESGEDREGGESGPGGSFGFGAGGPAGFDPASLRQMLSNAGTSAGTVNYDIARQLADQQLGTVAPVRSGERDAVLAALRLAEIWLDDVTPL